MPLSGKNESHVGGLPRSAHTSLPLRTGPPGAKFENRTRATQVCGDGPSRPMAANRTAPGLVRFEYWLSLQARADPLLGGRLGVLKREA